MRKRQVITSKNTEWKYTINSDSNMNENDDSMDELISSIKLKRNHVGKETPLRKMSSTKKLDSSEKENLSLKCSDTVKSVNRKKSSGKDVIKKDFKSNQKSFSEKEVLQMRQNDSKRKSLDIHDDLDMEKRFEEAIRKMEEFEKKYNCLKDLRQTQVESNFLAYRETAESRFKASQALIDSLTEDLNIKDKKLADLLSSLNNLKIQKHEFEKMSENLKSTEQALSRAKSQIAHLNAKLSLRSNASIVQLKEELYSDLTGLLIRDVKLDSKKTVFDCLQTGRNGTLHFKLSLFSDPSFQSQERFSYTPLFDEERDAPLLNCLPDYLTDEIIFEKDQAAMFSWRLSSALQKKD